MEPEENRDVHTEHCCLRHGCKYRHADCPVETGKKQQSYPCEDCERDEYNFDIFMDRYKDKIRAAVRDIVIEELEKLNKL